MSHHSALMRSRSTLGKPPRWKLLAIDDEPHVIDALKRGLLPYGFDVIGGYHGYQGIWQGITEHPDAIITDIRMPFADGEVVTECLLRNPATSAIPIFALTGLHSEKLRRRLLQRGVAEVFSKPADAEALAAVLLRHLEQNADPNSTESFAHFS